MIFANEIFTLEQSSECAVPGYLVLRLKSGEKSLAELSRKKTQALGEMLARAVRAIEETVGADRVYVLSFCEVDRRLHFHLFPRTDWILKAYENKGACPGQAVNGPALFAWARKTFIQSGDLPAGIPRCAAATQAIRVVLEAQA